MFKLAKRFPIGGLKVHFIPKLVRKFGETGPATLSYSPHIQPLRGGFCRAHCTTLYIAGGYICPNRNVGPPHKGGFFFGAKRRSYIALYKRNPLISLLRRKNVVCDICSYLSSPSWAGQHESVHMLCRHPPQQSFLWGVSPTAALIGTAEIFSLSYYRREPNNWYVPCAERGHIHFSNGAARERALSLSQV